MDDGRQTSIAQTVTRCHLWVRGRVQGVGYRIFALQEAQRWGVVGWARNLPDGRVEIIAEGDIQALEQFMAGMRRGPAGARVEDFRVEWEAPANMRGFRIQ